MLRRFGKHLTMKGCAALWWTWGFKIGYNRIYLDHMMTQPGRQNSPSLYGIFGSGDVPDVLKIQRESPRRKVNSITANFKT